MTNKQLESAFSFAVSNIAHYGDTDVLPFPIENHIFHDMPDQVVALLMSRHRQKTGFRDEAIFSESMLSSVGYSGFRQVTQIDPYWNAMFLGLVISAGTEIEKARLPKATETVYSYRFEPDPATDKLFSTALDFRTFEDRSRLLAETYPFVVTCDISDFYARIYHHPLENALLRSVSDTKVVKRIIQLVTSLSKNVSYGLPVGGPASRILSEILLNNTDRLLSAAGVPYCRYSDDYRLFAREESAAYSHLIFLSEKLLGHEGLTLQRQKTRIMSSEEYLAMSSMDTESDDPKLSQARRAFMHLRLFYDPYSATAAADYANVKSSLEQFDVIAMLGAEVRKSRIYPPLARRLVQSIEYLPAKARETAVETIFHGLKTLSPVLPTVLIALKNLVIDEKFKAKELVFRRIRELIDSESFLVRPSCNLAFAVRILAYDNSLETDATLYKVFSKVSFSAIRRDIILAMARRGSHALVADILKNFGSLGTWERRATIIASYMLTDQGSHWRKNSAGGFNEFERLVLEWMDSKPHGWKVPL